MAYGSSQFDQSTELEALRALTWKAVQTHASGDDATAGSKRGALRGEHMGVVSESVASKDGPS